MISKSPEYSVALGEIVRPRQVMNERDLHGRSLVLEVRYPSTHLLFDINFGPFSLDGFSTRGVSTLYARTCSTNIRNIISDEEAEALKSLMLSVRLPDEESWITAVPNLAELYGYSHLSLIKYYSFNRPDDAGIDLIPLDRFKKKTNPKAGLPVLVVPSRRKSIFRNDQDRGALAFRSDKIFQEGIEIKFDLPEPGQIPTVTYGRKEVISFEWVKQEIWKEKDWTSVLGYLSTRTLLSIYRQLTDKIRTLAATIQEIDYIRDISDIQTHTSKEYIAQNLFGFQLSQKVWIKEELQRRSSPVA